MKNLKIQNKLLDNIKNENAITLVALIITIIILIILAVVTINALTHDGLADLAIKSTQDYQKAQSDEMNMLNEIDTMVKETLKNIEDGTTKPKPEEPEKPTNPWGKDNLDEVKVKDEDGNDVSIPKPDDSTILNPDNEIDDGIVMKDANDNEWVWVPVDEATYNSMFAENPDGILMSGATNVKATKYSKSATLIGQIVQVLPNSKSGYREPGIVVGNDSQYDAVESNRTTASSGFTTLEKTAEILRDEYNTMADSIKKYGGFYIGRYELTANGSKAGVSLTNQTWYQLYKQCKELSVDETKGIARMVWRMPVGCYMFMAKKYRI